MLYGERIGLVRILSDTTLGEFGKAREIIKLLHDIDITPHDAASLDGYIVRIVQGLNAWLLREKNECYVPPLPEQMQAGIETMSKEIGDMGGVVAMAKQFCWTFEQVYKMPYTDVFTIWKVDAEREKYERRYHKIMSNQSKGRKK